MQLETLVKYKAKNKPSNGYSKLIVRMSCMEVQCFAKSDLKYIFKPRNKCLLRQKNQNLRNIYSSK